MDQMDQKLLRQREAKCIQENPPGCTARCPVHVDVKGIVEAVGKKEYAKGFALFTRMVPFPGIISRICDQPCQQACKRAEIDETIFIRGLEQICVDQVQNTHNVASPPTKNKTAAIVGAGLSGLTAAFELGRKGYKVEVFEASDRLGGLIWDYQESRLPRQWIQKDFSVLAKLPVEIHYNTKITSLDHLIDQFDAVYVGTGFQQNWDREFSFTRNAEGELELDLLTLATEREKVFAGGGIRRFSKQYSPISSLADGKMAAISIDRLFQNASLSANREHEGPFTTSLYTNTDGIQPEPMVQAADPVNGYTEEEAAREADRCLLCECLECVKVCEYLAHYRSYPKRYVREIYNNLSIVMGIHRANKMINSCSLCGLCAEVCPGNLDMGEICLEARRTMVDKGKMPLSTHDFALRDMRFSNSELCALDKNQPGFTASQYVFFPGCQLSASSPNTVKQAYVYLTEKLAGGVGLMLGCCGAPAIWAGQEALFQETMRTLETSWHSLGEPQIIAACPACCKIIADNLPELPVKSVWEVMDQIGLPDRAEALSGLSPLAIHDSCTARYKADVQNSVRNLAGKLGCQVEELPLNRDNTTCCSYGGLMFHANREVAEKVIRRRVSESESDYLTYCIMCRDNFAGQGKRTHHLLDLIFAKDNDRKAGQKGPGYSQRQENRERLKNSLLQDVWGETVEERPLDAAIIVPEQVRPVLEERMILDDDIRKVIAYAESSGNKLKDMDSDRYIAYHQIASVTYWVEYFPENDTFIVQNAYSHRITITD